MQPGHSFWRGKTVAVTGGTGFLGFHLVRQLTELGAAVRVLALPPDAEHPLRRQSRVECFFGDLLDSDLTRRGLDGCAVVFHLAGPVAVWDPGLMRMHHIHTAALRNVLAAAPAARVVHTSSITAIGASRERQVLDETSPFNLEGLRVDYVHAKRAAEQMALAAAAQGRDVVVVNPGYLVGPDDREGSIMGRLCARFWKRRRVAGAAGRFQRGGCARRGARYDAGGRARLYRPARYILGGTNLTVRRFLRQLAAAGDLRPRWLPRLPRFLLRVLSYLAEGRGWLFGKEPYPSRQHTRVNDYYWFVRSNRAERELGYRARPLSATLADTSAWFHEHRRVVLRGCQRWWLRPRHQAGVDHSLAGRNCWSSSPR